MKKIDAARALRDEDRYLELSDFDRATLGDHPSGTVEIPAQDLRHAVGAALTKQGSTVLCTPCPGLNCGA